MRIAMIGTGYVGLVSGACFSEFGHHVTCIDKDAKKIEALRGGVMPIYEPRLDDLVVSNARAGRLEFSTELAGPVSNADIVFIAVGTPSRRGDGHADLSYVFAAAEELAPSLRDYTVVVTKSTVPVGTGRKVQAIIAQKAPRADFDIASNPEFLREGSAIDDFMRPDRVVVGCETDRARTVLREVYRPLFLNETPVVVTGLESAELAKYAANAFLATKVMFINEMADMCERSGADVQDVAKAMGLDRRIGAKFLHAGPGYGGSCFPKDTRALLHQSVDLSVPSSIVAAVVEANEARKVRMAEKVVRACGGSVAGKTLAVLGVAFKPNTDDMREAPSLVILPELQKAGAAIRAYDPEGMKEAKAMLPGVTWCKDAYDTFAGADAVVLLTEWNEFRSLDLERVKKTLRHPVFIDLRNVYRPEEMIAAGFSYASIGRQTVVAPARPMSAVAGRG